MAEGEKQVPLAGMRENCLGLDRHIVKSRGAANSSQAPGQIGLRFERDDAAMTNPARKPVDEAPLVGADVAGDIARPQVGGDDPEFGRLIAEPRFQRAKAKAETLIGQPRLKKRHRSTLAGFYGRIMSGAPRSAFIFHVSYLITT